MGTFRDKVEAFSDMIRDNERHPIFLYGLNLENYEAIKIMTNRHVYPHGIIATEVINKSEKLYGIKIFTLDEVLDKYGSNSVIIINLVDFKKIASILLKHKYAIKKNLYIDFSLISGLNKAYLLITKLKLVCHIPIKNVNRDNSMLHLITCIKENIKHFIKLIYGFRIYTMIQKQYDAHIPLLVYDYSGLGDVYIFCMLIYNNYEQIYHGKFAVSVIGNGCKEVTKLFSLKNVHSLTANQSSYLSAFLRFCGEKYQIFSITPFPGQIYSDVISKSVAGRKLNMLDVYKYGLFGLDESSTVSYPSIPKDITFAQKLFKENKLIPGKTVIISPYANTVIGYSLSLWSSITLKLNEMGYTVCTNCNGREEELPGTIRLSYPIDKAESVVNYAGFFVAIRNGFCDIICNTECKKIIIYPIYEIFNSTLFDFCSFTKMNIGRNIEEIQWGYDNLNILAEHVIKRIEVY